MADVSGERQKDARGSKVLIEPTPSMRSPNYYSVQFCTDDGGLPAQEYTRAPRRLTIVPTVATNSYRK
jgi:hypothetical protein